MHGGRDRHAAFKVEGMADLISRLDRAGISYASSKAGRDALFCRDPDQNALEFIAN